MHDIRQIRENPEAFDASLARRGLEALSSSLLALDEARRSAITASETAKSEMNQAAARIGRMIAEEEFGQADFFKSVANAKKAEMAKLREQANTADAALRAALLEIPNLPDADVPDGASEDDNVEMTRWGTPRTLDFTPVEHFDIAGVKPGMDFETAAKLSGARFVLLRGAVARIHRALAQFMLDTHIDENGLTETNTPVLVRDDAMLGTDKLPKFGDDSFLTREGFWLVPTSEVPLTYSVAGDVLEESTLPRRMVAHTLCFRSEAGSAGRDTSGMLRQHQFEKVEMVSITHPDHSRAELDRMTKCAEGILESLGLPYRTVILCTGDMGFGARRTHDIEVWLPGQDTYREISSCSTTGDFQARRMNARFKPAAGGKPEFVHTLNGSGLAVGRCLIAVLENGQQADGSVTLPAVLAPYLGGKTTLGADGVLT